MGDPEAANLVESIVDEALEVEAIEDDLGTGAAAFDDFDEGAGMSSGSSRFKALGWMRSGGVDRLPAGQLYEIRT